MTHGRKVGVIAGGAKRESSRGTGRGLALGVGALLLLAVLAVPPAGAQSVCWTANGVAVASLPTSVVVNDVTTAADGSGGVYVAWSDNRNGTYDIYLSRLDANGTVVSPWPYQGLAVCTMAGDQRHPRLAYDNAGGVYVAWEDQATPTRGIFLQRYASNSAIAAGWPVGCLAVRTSPIPQTTIDLSVQGTTNVYLTWREEVSFTNWNLFVQKLAASNGAAQWTANGKFFLGIAPYSDGSFILPDETGGAFLCWQQGNAGSTMIQRLASADGSSVWYTSPYPGYFVQSGSYRPQMVSDGAGGFWVSAETWVSPPGQYDVGLTRYDANGQGVSGAYFATAADEFQSRIVQDGSNGVVMSWLECTGSTCSFGVSHVAADGGTWCMPGGRILVPTNVWPYETYRLLGDDHGGGMLVWSENGDLFTRQVKSDGTTGSQITLCNAPGYQNTPSAVRTAGGKIAVAWPDPRSGFSNAAYAQCASYTPPNGPTGLTTLAITQIASRGLTAHWTVPNDQPPYGSATKFEVRHSTGVITEATYPSATLDGTFTAWGGPGTDMCDPISILNRCTTYYVAIKTFYSCGGWSLISNVPHATTWCSGNSITDCDVLALKPVGREDDPGSSSIIPDQLELKGPAMSPGAGPRTVEFGIPRELEGAAIDLTAFDVGGRRLRTLAHGVAHAGMHHLDWDGRDQAGSLLPRGVFFLRLNAGDRNLSRSFVVVR